MSYFLFPNADSNQFNRRILTGVFESKAKIAENKPRLSPRPSFFNEC